MKPLTLLGAAFLLLLASSAAAGMYTKGEKIACLTHDDLDTVMDAYINKQMATVNRLIERKRCFVMKRGLNVSIIESKGFLGATKYLRVFLPSGDTINVWTLMEEVEIR